VIVGPVILGPVILGPAIRFSRNPGAVGAVSAFPGRRVVYLDPRGPAVTTLATRRLVVQSGVAGYRPAPGTASLIRHVSRDVHTR
jgi:hypothetical protein